MVAFCSSTAEGNECNELRKRYLIPKAIPPKIFGMPESRALSIPVLSLYYDLMKIQPARGNVDPSIKLVLRFNENPADSC